MNNVSQPLMQLYQNFLLFLPKLIAALVIFVAGLYLSGLAARSVERAAKARDVDHELVVLVSRLTRWGVLVLGLVIALGQVNFNLTGFMAGLGIVGFTVGLAVQDVSRNFVSGLLLLMQQPFSIGDTIEVSGYTGTVVDISTRATELKTFDGLRVSIPNTDVYTSTVKHFGHVKFRRLDVSVGVAYDSDLDLVTRTVVKALAGIKGVVESGDQAPIVVYNSFGESSIDLTAYYWIDLDEVGFLDAQNGAFITTKLALEAAGIDMPYPTRTILTPKA